MKSLFAWAVLLAAVGFVPLFGGPRYEAALFAGLLGPFWCSYAAAGAVLGLLDQGPNGGKGEGGECSGGSLLLAISSSALSHVFLLAVVAALHGLFGGFCEPALGFGLLMLGPGLGMFLGAAWGGASVLFWRGVGALGARPLRLLSLVTATLAPLGSIALGLFHFYDSPSVSAYAPFVGYFAGPLYDTVEYDLERLAGYRMGSLLTLLSFATALVCVRVSREPGRRRRVGFLPPTRERVVMLVVAVSAALGSLAHAGLAEEMGYFRSTEGIRRALGRSVVRERCRVFFSRGVDQGEASLAAQECVGHLVQIEEYFGISGFPGVDIYLFASSQEKRHLMGAATTYIAKPWRREIYIQPGGFPHQVLGHELAHAVTGAFGEGPLDIAGHFGGWLPDPGRIEGFAEAASPKEGSEGTLHEWTAAMRQLKLLPPLSSLFQLSFLGAAPANAYSASGSFVDFVRRRHGPEALRAWYGGGDLSLISGASFDQLERDWHAFLDDVAIPPSVLEIARPRFSRPAVFERRCPHAVDRLISKAVDLCPYQEEKALRLAAQAVSLDPRKKDLELRNHRCAWYAGDAERSRRRLLDGARQEAEFEPGARRAAFEFAGDIAWATGLRKEAKEAYLDAQKLTFGLDQSRNLEVKLWALVQPDEIRERLRVLLAPRPRERKSLESLLTEWRLSGGEKELALYLRVRLLENLGFTEESDHLATLLSPDSLPLASLRLEGRKMKLLSACRRALRTKQSGVVGRALQGYLDAKPHPAGALEARRVAERCETALDRGNKSP